MYVSALISVYLGPLKPYTSEDSSSPSRAIFDQIIIIIRSLLSLLDLYLLFGTAF